MCSDAETPGLFLPSRRFDIPQKRGVELTLPCSPFPGVSISGLRGGAPPAGTPPLRPPQLQPRGGEDPTPPLLEEELGSASSPVGPHPEALFAAASVQQGLPVVQGQYLSQSSLCWALYHISCHFWKE